VLASNDGTAGGAVQALSEEGMAGKVLITGQDADLVALQRIAAGTQAMTIYKPLHMLAQGTAELAVKMGKGKPVIAKQVVNNGAVDVPSVLFDVVTVTKDNIDATVVKDGLYRHEDIFK
jgi:D-xylose transport system substrate-binding protein